MLPDSWARESMCQRRGGAVKAGLRVAARQEAGVRLLPFEVSPGAFAPTFWDFPPYSHFPDPQSLEADARYPDTTQQPPMATVPFLAPGYPTTSNLNIYIQKTFEPTWGCARPQGVKDRSNHF